MKDSTGDVFLYIICLLITLVVAFGFISEGKIGAFFLSLVIGGTVMGLLGKTTKE